MHKDIPFIKCHSASTWNETLLHVHGSEIWRKNEGEITLINNPKLNDINSNVSSFLLSILFCEVWLWEVWGTSKQHPLSY